jgi:arylsulfatase/uncharacterized sulfatase
MFRRLVHCLIFAALVTPTVTSAQDDADQPNVVIILVDDSALMDFGVYGGEAQTPHIDALAERGAMFTQYRTSPLCSPTRAMLLTGLDNHLTGVATIPEVLPEEQKGAPGYSMALEPGVLTIADRLREAGYRTLMSGKWHMGESAHEMPQAHGFDRSFALAASGADNWEDKSYIPYYVDAPWFEDGEEASLPEDFYSSEFIVDTMIRYLDETDRDRPFLAYLPFQAIHIPVQAPPEFTALYDGRFDEGWDVLQAARHERAQALGLISQGAPLASMPDDARPWQSLDAEARETYAARMAVNAGMLTAMDHHIGRFIDRLKAEGLYDNTVFIVTSDNGPEPSYHNDDPRFARWLQVNGYHTDLEGLGEIGSWNYIGMEWALAASSPGTLYKFYATEGGVRAPLIMAGPGIAPQRVDSPAMVTDVTPTLLEMINVPPADEASRTMTGRSLLPVLRGEVESAYAPGGIRAIEVSGNSALYRDGYKIVRSVAPVGDGQWRLYDLSTDPGEVIDLSEAQPARLESMLEDYADYAARVGVQPMPEGYSSTAQIQRNTLKRLRSRNMPRILAVLFLLLFGVAALARVPRKGQA